MIKLLTQRLLRRPSGEGKRRSDQSRVYNTLEQTSTGEPTQRKIPPIGWLVFITSNVILCGVVLAFALHVGLTRNVRPYPTLPAFMSELLAERPDGVNRIESPNAASPAKLISLIPDVIEQARRTLPPEIAQHIIMDGRQYTANTYYVALAKDFYNLSAIQARIAIQRLVEYLSLYGIEPVKFMVDLEVVHYHEGQYMDRTFTYPDVYNEWNLP